jgi:hypothetical protein
VDGIFETTLAIGRITDRPAEAERPVAAAKFRLEEIRHRPPGFRPCAHYSSHGSILAGAGT